MIKSHGSYRHGKNIFSVFGDCFLWKLGLKEYSTSPF